MEETLKPKITVILPTHNRAYCIKCSIDSVLNQSYKDFELIVIDDASTDNTEEIIREYESIDPRVHYIKHSEQKGAAYARNTGIEHARGELLAFQDSDDQWQPDKLAKQVSLLEHAPKNIGVVYCAFWRISGTKKDFIPRKKIIKTDGDLEKELLKFSFIGTPAALIKKECFSSCGSFDTSLRGLEDWDFFIRLAKKYKFIYIPDPLFTAYIQQDNISWNHHSLTDARKKIFLKHNRILRRYPLIFLRHVFNIIIHSADFLKFKKRLSLC